MAHRLHPLPSVQVRLIALVPVIAVLGCRSGDEGGARFTPFPHWIDPTVAVSGAAISGWDGTPAPGLRVFVDGQILVTDSSGLFHAVGVVAPYDLAFDDGIRVVYYEDVARLDPVLRTWMPRSFVYQRFVGSVSPAPTGATTLKTYLDGNGMYAAGFSTPPAFDLSTNWWKPTERISAIAYSGSGAGIVFESFGTADVAFARATTSSGITIPMEPVTMGTVSMTVTAPPDSTCCSVLWHLLENGNLISGGSSTATTLTVTTVDLPQASVDVFIDAFHPDGGGSVFATAPPNAVVAWDVPSSSRVTSPALDPLDAGAVVSWEAPDASYAYTVTAGEYVFFVGTKTTLKIPDLSLLDAPKELGSVVEVTGIAAGPTVDDLVGSSPALPAVQRISRGRLVFPAP